MKERILNGGVLNWHTDPSDKPEIGQRVIVLYIYNEYSSLKNYIQIALSTVRETENNHPFGIAYCQQATVLGWSEYDDSVEKALVAEYMSHDAERAEERKQQEIEQLEARLNELKAS